MVESDVCETDVLLRSKFGVLWTSLFDVLKVFNTTEITIDISIKHQEESMKQKQLIFQNYCSAFKVQYGEAIIKPRSIADSLMLWHETKASLPRYL